MGFFKQNYCLMALVPFALASCGGGGEVSRESILTNGAFNTTVNVAPVAIISAFSDSVLGDLVALDGSGSIDVNGDDLTYSWSIVSAPVSSLSELSDTDSPIPTFMPDTEGEYVFELTVNDGELDSSPFQTALNSHRPIESLDFKPVDAEYNAVTDKIIMISENPSQLHIYDPITHENTSIDLSLAPTSVSVQPDGLFAAVGHNGWISYVDLDDESLVKTFTVSTDVEDIVLAGNGYVYAFPRTDQWETIRSVNVSSEQETLSSGNQIRAGTLVDLHPSGNFIYGADNGLSPSDIEKYDISGGPAEYLYDSPYHGDFDMCGNLWLSEDGARVFTACGNVFQSSEVEANDMVYNGAFEGVSMIQYLDHSELGNEVAIISGNSVFDDSVNDTLFYIHNYDFLTLEEDYVLPSFVLNGQGYAGHGKHVFYHSDGEQIFVVLQADDTSGFLLDFGITEY